MAYLLIIGIKLANSIERLPTIKRKHSRGKNDLIIVKIILLINEMFWNVLFDSIAWWTDIIRIPSCTDISYQYVWRNINTISVIMQINSILSIFIIWYQQWY